MHYPINLDLKRMSIVIIGGGLIAYRKCKYFLEIKKEITVIAEQFISEFFNATDNINLIIDSYDESYINKANLIIIATNNRKLNREIALTSLEQGKLVNVADDKDLSNFHVPAVIKRGDFLLSISTGGKSPALSKKIKKDLGMIFDDTYENYVNLLGKGRSVILNNHEDPEVKKEKLKHLLSLSLEELTSLYG